MDDKPTYLTPEEQDYFERYLLGQMSAREQEGFESQLASHHELNSKFLEFKTMFRVIEEGGLRGKMDSFHQDFENDEKIRQIRPKISKTFYRIAATVAILIGLGGFWYFNAPNSNERLFNTYFMPDPGLPTVMGNTTNYAFYEAMVDYKMGNYDVALQKWEGLLVEGDTNDTLIYFLGMANLAEGNSLKTIAYLEHNLTSNSPAFLNETFYFLGMAYLKSGNFTAAVENLKKSGLPKAQKVLKSLE